MSNKLQLWVDINENKLLSGWLSVAERKELSFRNGDIIDIELHKVKKSNFADGVMEEVPFEEDEVIKVALSSAEQFPSSGLWSLSYGSETVKLDYSVRHYELENKLNELVSIFDVGGVTVSSKGDYTFLVLFNETGAKDLLTANFSNLIPSSTVFIDRIKTGNETTNEVQLIKLRCDSLAYTNTFTDGLQPSITKSVITNDLGSGFTNITRFSIEPQPKGGYFKITDGDSTTSLISVYANEEAVKSIITASGIFDANGFAVKKVGSFTWDIYQLSGVEKNLTTLSEIVKFDSKNCTLSLNTADINYETSDKESIKLIFEIEVSNNGKKSTIYQSKVMFYTDVIK